MQSENNTAAISFATQIIRRRVFDKPLIFSRLWGTFLFHLIFNFEIASRRRRWWWWILCNRVRNSKVGRWRRFVLLHMLCSFFLFHWRRSDWRWRWRWSCRSRSRRWRWIRIHLSWSLPCIAQCTWCSRSEWQYRRHVLPLALVLMELWRLCCVCDIPRRCIRHQSGREGILRQNIRGQVAWKVYCVFFLFITRRLIHHRNWVILWWFIRPGVAHCLLVLGWLLVLCELCLYQPLCGERGIWGGRGLIDGSG